jgi:hypothetical protein
MKTMICKELGGACSKEFKGETFEEIAEQSKQHGMEMFRSQDAEHLEAMVEMQKLMQDSAAMSEWFFKKKEEFDALPDN